MCAWPIEHPTLSQYLVAAQAMGSKVVTGNIILRGYHVAATKIITAQGKKVSIIGTKQSEYLTMTTVERLDRRLGIKSDFFKL